ncbi:MAG: hypothetical protein H6704_11235 [Myxococcales bacterium]|nr:hypothetical protein [Myxococcales bacterium]
MNAPWHLRDPDAPSELTLDAFVAGEATPDEAARVEAWAAADPAHQAALDARRAGFAALPSARPQAMQARIAQALEARPVAATPWWRRWRLPVLLPLAAATTAALVLALRGPLPTPLPDDPGLRAKGSLTLRVFRAHDDAVAELISGDAVEAGDRLRFRPEGAPPDAHLLVVGREAGGALFAYAPLDGRSLPAGALDAEGALPGAAELDASTGPEWVWLVACDRAFDLGDLAPAGDAGRLRTPAGCRTAAFEIVKR